MDNKTMKLMLFAALFAALTAAVSPIRIPLGFTPVPITLQTLMVLLAGAVLGARYGALSQGLYLLVGALGLPVFAGGSSGLGVLFGPTGGYLLSYPLAAAAVGMMKGQKGGRLAKSCLVLLGLLLLVVYADLIFSLGIIAYGGSPLVSLMSPGQRVAFIIVSLAAIIGLYAWQRRQKGQAQIILGMAGATLIIYALGAVWGKLVTGLPWGAVLVGWVLPFLIGDTVKLLIAAAIARKADLKPYL